MLEKVPMPALKAWGVICFVLSVWLIAEAFSNLDVWFFTWSNESLTVVTKLTLAAFFLDLLKRTIVEWLQRVKTNFV